MWCVFLMPAVGGCWLVILPLLVLWISQRRSLLSVGLLRASHHCLGGRGRRVDVALGEGRVVGRCMGVYVERSARLCPLSLALVEAAPLPGVCCSLKSGCGSRVT